MRLLALDVEDGGTQVVDDVAGDEALLALLGGSEVARVAVDEDAHPHAGVG